MATIEQRRKADRERRERWRKKKLAEGNKQFQFMLTPEAQKVLKREKKLTGQPYVEIINRAIVNISNRLPAVPEKTKARTSALDKTKSNQNEQLKLFKGS